MNDKKKSLTVFDCDDVLLNLNEAVYPFLGLPNPTSFKYRISGQYTQSQVDDITRLYGDPETFKRASFAKGADKIFELENYGTDVRICTRSFNEEVEAVKRVILPEHTHVSLDHIEFQIGLGHEKLLPDKADIMVEDCLDNLLKLPQPVIRILINKSHNQESSAFDFYNRIYRFKDLVDALEFIKHILSSGLIYNYSWRRADFMSHPIPGIPFERYKQCQVARNRQPLTEDQIKKYLEVAKTLESEKNLLGSCISWNCVNRYVYSRTIDSMEESVKIIRELVALLERKEGVIHK